MLQLPAPVYCPDDSLRVTGDTGCARSPKAIDRQAVAALDPHDAASTPETALT